MPYPNDNIADLSNNFGHYFIEKVDKIENIVNIKIFIVI